MPNDENAKETKAEKEPLDDTMLGELEKALDKSAVLNKLEKQERRDNPPEKAEDDEQEQQETVAAIVNESNNQTNAETKNAFEEIEEIEFHADEHRMVFAVYILNTVVKETLQMCRDAMPNEAIGILLGHKKQFNGEKYVQVIDWATGKANQSYASARFTPEGVQEYTNYVDEKYGEGEDRPKIVGIIHSHPFGGNPHFSGTDYNTFLNFPYDAEHNVFVLVDPTSGYYKAYIVVRRESGEKDLQEVDWVEYRPKKKQHKEESKVEEEKSVDTETKKDYHNEEYEQS